MKPGKIDTPFATKKKNMNLKPIHIEVLRHYSRGLTLKEISKTIFRAPGTLQNDSERIRNIMGAKNLTHATAIAIREGLI